MKLSTRRQLNEEDSTFMRKNSRFGNYWAPQTEDKSQKEAAVSLLGTDHAPSSRGCIQREMNVYRA